MAIMIPVKPHIFDPASQEGTMFDALTLLPDEYYVFHSFKISTVQNNTFMESETDFVIYNPDKGVLCIEAKAGAVHYENGYWHYSSGRPMHNGGPFNQASANKWKLLKYVENSRMSEIIKRCKFLHGVWFPTISESILRAMTLPSESDRDLIMTKEALFEPLKYIEKIFNIELPNKVITQIKESESKRFIRELLCPQFNVFPATTFDSDLKKIIFHRLLKEQTSIINFLDEQKTAVINGAAGTGKTMIAVEKAKRHAAENEKTLFLCYNSKLKTFLSENYSDHYIDYYTIPGFACMICNTKIADYKKLKAKLEDMYLAESFPYQHVIVDEGQDFGIDDIDEADILESIKLIITDIESLNGTFYVFYDKLQLIHSNHIPEFIQNADCKLTLYRNCRNTENIATTSLRPILERKPKLLEGCVKGAPAQIHFCSDPSTAIERLDEVIDKLKADGHKDIVILTSKTETTSILSDKITNELYRNKYLFTTCRKFKGLESDVVILIDVDGESFKPENVLLYYVGTSRARIHLEIITLLSENDCIDVLKNYLCFNSKIKNPMRDFSNALNAVGLINI